ncbi:MAG: cytochrome c oxidase assembly protein [Rickettsiales bacterium]
MSNKNTKLAFNLITMATGMFMLAYASVPLYRLFCEVTGYGGTTQKASMAPQNISQRTINIEFNADIDPALNWEFKPGERSHKVKIGEQTLTYYVAHNRENQPVTGRSVYNVVPFKAGIYFSKIECFCFTEQTLEAGQKVDMPVSFFIDPAMLNDPDMKDVNTITLSYTFFPVKK